MFPVTESQHSWDKRCNFSVMALSYLSLLNESLLSDASPLQNLTPLSVPLARTKAPKSQEGETGAYSYVNLTIGSAAG
jgi:hypothetical protein